MARVPIKRGQTEEEIEHYYFLLEIRAKKDFNLSIAAGHFSWRKGDNPNRIKCCEYGRLGFEAAAAVVHPLILVYNYIYRYQRNHTPWESIPIPTKNYPLLGPHDVYNCLLELSRENQELFLRQFDLTNRQRDDILMSLLPTGYGDEFEAVYGDLSNAQEVSNLCWELGLYHPDEDDLILSRILEMPEIYDKYLDRTQTEDWEEIEHVPITNLLVLNRVQDYYDDYCEGRRLIKENGDFINKKEKEIINEILMRPEGELFRNAYDAGIVHLIEYDAESFEEVNIEDYTITSCLPFDDIEWEVDKEPFPLGIKVLHKPTSLPDGQQPVDHNPSAEETPKEQKETPYSKEETKVSSSESVNMKDERKQSKRELKPMVFPKSSRGGRPTEHWLIKRYATIPGINDKVAKLLKAKVWPSLMKEVRTLTFPISLNDRSRTVLCASLVFHAAELSGIATVETIIKEKRGSQYDGTKNTEELFDARDDSQQERDRLNGILVGQNLRIREGDVGLSVEEPTKKWARFLPSSYRNTLRLMNINVSQGGPMNYLRMLNYWLPKYNELSLKQSKANEESKKLSFEGEILLHLNDCRKEIKSLEELMEGNREDLSSILKKLEEGLPSYFDSIK